MKYLRETYFFDFSEEIIQNLISEFTKDKLTKKVQAIGLYNKIRDQWCYDPYTISLSHDAYKSSTIANKNTGNCVEKSILLISCLRALRIPARLHLGKVKNHIAVERLTEKFGSNELTPHGMVNVEIDGKWLKMSPAFNAELCKKFNVEPINFDGENNSFLQQYNNTGNLFMEYVDDYGFFEDVPVEFMVKNIKEHYPHIFNTDTSTTEFKL